MHKTFISLTKTLVAGYLLLAMLLFVFQRNLLYHPSRVIDHGYKETVMPSGDARIVVIMINPGQSSAVIYFGGNAEAVARNAKDFESALPNHTTYLMNYRGYSGSSGSPNEVSIHKDALKLFDQAASQHDIVALIGRSLGSGVATYVAAARDAAAIVLVTPYDSIRNVAQSVYPIFPADLILLDSYDSISRVPEINEPVMVLMAASDAVIPARFTANLVNAFPQNQVQVHQLGRTNHNSISRSPEYYPRISDFLGDSTLTSVSQ